MAHLTGCSVLSILGKFSYQPLSRLELKATPLLYYRRDNNAPHTGVHSIHHASQLSPGSDALVHHQAIPLLARGEPARQRSGYRRTEAHLEADQAGDHPAAPVGFPGRMKALVLSTGRLPLGLLLQGCATRMEL